MSPYRRFLVALEAAFAFTFCAMASKTDYHYAERLCPWILEDLEYDRLCSHTSLEEWPRTSIPNLTTDMLRDLHALSSEAKEE